MAEEKAAPKRLFTPVATANYPYLFVARMPTNAKPGQKARFSVDLYFPPEASMTPEDQARMKAINAACLKAAVDKWGIDKVKVWMKDNKLKLPFKKDIASREMDESKFESYIQPWTQNPPGVVSNKAYPKGHEKAGKPIPIVDPKDIYSGCQLRASVRPWTYDTDGNRGVNLGLLNVQKVGEGERLDGRVDAEDEFEATEEADASELESLMGGGSETGGGSDDDELAALLG